MATQVVTGAFGYTGKHITERLLAAGVTVRTLTNSPNRANPFGGGVAAHPFNFDQPDRLAASLEGAEVLYNTYWVRFNHRLFTHAEAVRNTLALFEAAKRAGVRRVVHVSITNPSEDSPLEYFSGKAALERALRESGLSYAILRPTVIFGEEDILVNNIAWTLRRFPFFGVFGDGGYRLQPIHVGDFADLAVAQAGGTENTVIDAIGPETFTYRELVEDIGRIIGCPRPVVSVPHWLGYAVGWLIGKWTGDVTITRDEIEGLTAGLLYTESPPAGTTRLTEWAARHADTLGRRYASEVARRVDRESDYGAL
ncbi:MAG: NAD(P)H-binding protein [Candidatus Hydrogenedens sp.]|nr:NAD(P)H-binding protein [Candidatus Hydrogenedentota bacterium]NLF58412.1 NAD(P)H-binding protein [Candidatus Hydrogenedens sp.]